MISTTIRIATVLAVVVVLSAGAAWSQSQPAEKPAVPAAAKPFGTPVADKAAPAPAQAPATGAAAAAPASQPASQPGTKVDQCGQMGGSQGIMFAMMGGVIVLFWFMGRGKRKQEAARREMLANIKKGDKVTTIGGMIGTVADVREDEVVIKVDDDTRIHMARWAVRGVGEEAKAENPEQAKKQQEKK